jgi:hypothetical protein
MLDTLLTDALAAYNRAKASGNDKALMQWARMILSILKQQKGRI